MIDGLTIGIEIELFADLELFKLKLEEAKIPFIHKRILKKIPGGYDVLILKEDISLPYPEAFEINFPPNYNKEDIIKVLDILNNMEVRMNHLCALHIHVGFPYDKQKLENLRRYYIQNQDDIINSAIQKNLYANLNYKLSETNLKQKPVNLNTYPSIICHGTVEHRIYKSTINIQEVF